MNRDRESGILVSVDQKTAFDLVNWDFLFKTLQSFQINDRFFNWIKLFYKPGLVKSTVMVNGFLCKPFCIFKGLRQGCPLSPLLYIFVAETFCNLVRSDPNIKGVSLGTEIKLNCYADDINFFLSDLKSLQKISNF